MKVYDEKHIKNIVLIGNAKSGKTTLAETMLFEAGLINRRGTIEVRKSNKKEEIQYLLLLYIPNGGIIKSTS